MTTLNNPKESPRALAILASFLASESAGGIVLMGAALAAIIVANSPMAAYYFAALHSVWGGLSIELWINDGLMALFFLLIGLEVKREVLEGQLAKPSQIVLPGAAAIGGMLVPALIYWFLNRDNPPALNGWAIPTATDIAFALGVLALLGKRVPTSLKLFLMTLAIIDDLGAIVIIAIFYSGTLSTLSLMLAGACIAALVAMNRMGVVKLGPYMIIGLILWVCVLKSGVHATLAGVTLAFCIPLRTRNAEPSPLKALEHALHPWVSFGILPLFAFANAGLSLSGVTLESFTHHVPMGIAVGLLLGKTIGVFGLTWMAVKTGIAALPSGANWGQVLGVAILCGIGFTMSLFVGSLAFEPGSSEYAGMDRMGILTGSLFAALIGYAVTAAASRRNNTLAS
jgi:NhaA family Na+:H+ antiporter